MLRNVRCNWVRKFSSISGQLPKLPECRYTKSSEYEGVDYQILKNAHATVLSPSLKPFYKSPLLLHEGKGQWIWDHQGKRYLDMFGGIATVSVGHCHPKVVRAITKQAPKLGHISPVYMHSSFYEYAEKLTAKLPPELNTIYLMNSGSEANELAFLMARIYTKEQAIISLRNSYHGGTYSTSATTAMSNWRHPIPQPAGHIHVKNPDVYRGPWGGAKCRDSPIPPNGRTCDCTDTCMASEKYFDEFQDVFRYTLPRSGRLAAFIAESIQGIGGVVQYPKTFLKKVYELVHQNGGLFIADEVQTGFGRTGEHFWGFEGHDVQPDIVTLAKGIGNGFPLGAVVTTAEIADKMNQILHFNTYGSNPIACAVGSAVLDVIEEEQLQNNALTVGTHLLGRLSSLTRDFPSVVGDVRGKGLMVGVELISDRATKKELGKEDMDKIFEDIREMRVLVGRGGVESNVLRIKPPMCVTTEDADYTFEVIKIALEKHMDRRR